MIPVNTTIANKRFQEERSKRLDAIVSRMKSHPKQLFAVSLDLLDIYNEKLYIEAGYKNVYEFGKAVMNVERGTISYYLTIARKYLNRNTGKSVFASNDGDFGFMQLLECHKGKLSVNEVSALMKDGKFSYSSTTKEIRDAITEYHRQEREDAQTAQEMALAPLVKAYEEFHTAYNDLRAYLSSQGLSEGIDKLQGIMDAVVIIYNEKGLKES